MPTILAVDTSAKSVSCAIVQNQRVLTSFYSNTGLTHSQTLLPMVDDLLREANISFKEIDAFAVNAGPGSFTGVRIGVSAVKGLAFAHETPCIAVSTLECMTENIAIPSDAILCGVMDARCQQVYAATFTVDEYGNSVRLSEDAALSIEDLGHQLREFSNPIILVGDGSEICYNALKDTIPNLILSPAAVRYQCAAGTALVAERHYIAGETLSAEELLPIYLRLPQAERELNARLKK